MTLDQIIVAGCGALIVIFIYWFFFGKNDDTVEVEDSVDIVVDGGYKPENIKIKMGQTTKLIFERKDPNSCLEEIIIPDFKIKKYLPLNNKVEIDLIPQKPGVYQTHCGMGMFHGKIIVE